MRLATAEHNVFCACVNYIHTSTDGVWWKNGSFDSKVGACVLFFLYAYFQCPCVENRSFDGEACVCELNSPVDYLCLAYWAVCYYNV